MPFSPIAVVGRACVLPGALSPEALWQLVANGKIVTGPAPVGRWGIRDELILSASANQTHDRSLGKIGGYVSGFEQAFDPEGFVLSSNFIETLDPLFHWLLHTGRIALQESRFNGKRERIGAIVGNLSYPSQSLSRFAERTWFETQPNGAALAQALGLPDISPHNRFMSGLPAHLLAKALGLGQGAFALDAACASSLYAIKFACDALANRRADLMLAGAVNRADDLFIHAGFTALGALSPTGRSRPFHEQADGLIPAEGAAILALARLEDAQRDELPILGVIRGIGLSNDGRGRGLLVPSQPGQVRALRSAYASAGMTPEQISYVECHATGTMVGDAIEIATLSEVFANVPSVLPIGSLKANMGHLITAAGAAGLIKVLSAFAEGIAPATPSLDEPSHTLTNAPVKVLTQNLPWTDSQGLRTAAVSAFGFGGNNAHLIIQEPPRPRAPVSIAVPETILGDTQIAVVAMGARVADGNNVADFAKALFTGKSCIRNGSAAAREIAVSMSGLRFPPRDLEETLPQQLMVFAAAREAVETVQTLPNLRTGVFIGMQCDAEIARHGARWRSAEWGEQLQAGDEWVSLMRESFVPLLGSAGVLGAMPNIPANRLSSQLDLGGPSFTVSAEELSGIRALQLAERALCNREIDAAIVGAVDLSAEPVQQAASRILGDNRHIPGDAAIVFVLKRLDDAQAAGDDVLCVLKADQVPSENVTLRFGDGPDAIDLQSQFGHAHAASGLLHVAAAVLSCSQGVHPGALSRQNANTPAFKRWNETTAREAEVTIAALGDQIATVRISARHPVAPLPQSAAEIDLRLQALQFKAHHPEAPVFVLPAHRPPPTIPEVPRARATFEMPTAPSLPTPSTTAAMKVGSFPSLASQGFAYRQQVAQVHQVYLSQQAAVHTQFLALRQKAMGALLGQQTLPKTSGPARPSFSRRELEIHASGRISEIFGPEFAQQDGHTLQVRMPEPPLLLADRVVDMDAIPGTMGLGTVWTETDVHADSWFLNRGFMPAGIMIEAGQADLFLISYLGIDALNKGKRAYRLLGCELTYHGSLPKPGDTLRYAITIDSHARQGDTRLFFFHYDCKVGNRNVLTVRKGQAGFFSKAELDDSAGVLWKPEDQEICDNPRLDPPVVPAPPRSFSTEQVRAFADGKPYECFGSGFELTQTHTRSPAIQNDKMLLVGHIGAFDPKGGPWGRGYLKAVTPIASDDWFFKGHFKNDPCMPGTLMFEGCLQAMAFYLAAMGYTLARDGWRFEPVPDEAYQLQCRGQVVPSSKELVCELFVEEVLGGPHPTLYADLLGTVDGLKAFHARRVGLRLVPDWPLSDRAIARVNETAPPAINGFTFDHASLMACAWGRPSDAFGPMYRIFDGQRRVARLPGPPYHFMSRVVRIDGELGACKPGGTIEIEYDVPEEAWYFDENGQRTMPYCVLLEAVLQPCGWLASFVGSALLGEDDLAFRNLDGKGVVYADIRPGYGTLRTTTTLTSVSRSGGMILENFEVKCFMGDTLVYALTTGFGFFPKAALENQVGLPTTVEERALLQSPSTFAVDLTQRPARYTEGELKLPNTMLLMLDRITAYDRNGGSAGLGFARAEKSVNPAEWFFKAHFFQDPVQPGSLGIEAMLQLLQFVMLHEGLGEGFRKPRFEAIALNEEMVWKYRGQVVPNNRIITTTLEITSRTTDAAGHPLVCATASLWVDEKRIYSAHNIGMRIVDDLPAKAEPRGKHTTTLLPQAMLPQLRSYWQRELGVLSPPVDQIFSALVTRFLAKIEIDGAKTQHIIASAPRGVLFLANHQISLESTVFGIVGSALVQCPILTLARIENQHYWLELLMQHCFRYPGSSAPPMAKGFDRKDSASLPGIIEELSSEMRTKRRSVMVHVEGTRSLHCADPVRTLSGTFIDMALALDCPIVPLRFVGGLPREPLHEKVEFPVGMGKQTFHLGEPIAPESLRPLNYGQRRAVVLDAINGLPPHHTVEEPSAPDLDFEAKVQAWHRETGAGIGHATFFRLLQSISPLCTELEAIASAKPGDTVVFPDTPEGQWLVEIARRLFGPRGPTVR